MEKFTMLLNGPYTLLAPEVHRTWKSQRDFLIFFFLNLPYSLFFGRNLCAFYPLVDDTAIKS